MSDPGWPVKLSPEAVEQLRRDFAKIAEAERQAHRDARLVWLGGRDD